MYNYKAHQGRQRRLYEIIQCMKEGLNIEQIADELGVSKRTIQKDIKYIRDNQDE